MPQHTLFKRALVADPTTLPAGPMALDTGEAAPVNYWTGAQVGWVSFLLGFPAGTLLACINWHRMGLGNKIKAHVIAVPLIGLLLYLVQDSLPGIGTVIVIAVALGYTLYLATVTDSDITRFASMPHGEMRREGWLSASLIGLLGMVGYLVFAFLFALTSVLIEILSSPLPFEP